MLIHGHQVAHQLLSSLPLHTLSGHPPTLRIFQVGDHAPSKIYIRNKIQACKRAGLIAKVSHFPEDTQTSTLLDAIKRANHCTHTHGILLQLPLPNHLDQHTIVAGISPDKDVDCLSPLRVWQFYNQPHLQLTPPTALAVLKIIQHLNIDLSGKRVTILGHGLLVGKPVSLLLAAHGATVTVCHQASCKQDIEHRVESAEILILATGCPQVIPSHFIPSTCVVIDVGISRREDGSICGDIYEKHLEDNVKAITPVPGGVGPVTVACLIHNVIKLYQTQLSCHEDT